LLDDRSIRIRTSDLRIQIQETHNIRILQIRILDTCVCDLNLSQVVPDYYEHIKFPMDLKTMGERLKSDYYKNKRLFIADFKRMLQNCKVSLLFAFRLYLAFLKSSGFQGHNRERSIPCISSKFFINKSFSHYRDYYETNKAKYKYQD
jgi:hypothetical protein